MIRPVILAAALLLLCAAAPADRSGVYGNIRMSPVTGDAGGIQLELKDGPEPTVLVAVCEGGCWGGKTWPARIEGDIITFSVEQELFDGHGEVSSRETYNYRGQFKGRTLHLQVLDNPSWGKMRLRRERNPVPGSTAVWATF